MAKTATQRRAERDFGHVLDKNVLLLAMAMLVFGLVPDARPWLGGVLRMLGNFIETCGSIVITEQLTSAKDAFTFKWLLALAALLSPLLLARLIYESGKTAGLQQTVAETKELRV